MANNLQRGTRCEMEGLVPPESFAAIAAFISGIGSVLTGWLALRWERKRSREECADRIAAFHSGVKMVEEIEDLSARRHE